MSTSPAKKAIDTNRGKLAPFVTNQGSLHDHQPQKINGKTYSFSSSQIPNIDQHVATMTIPLQVSVPASFFSSSSNYYSFKMQAGRYSSKNLTLEIVLSNTLAAAVQLVPVPILVDYIRISTGSGAILQTLYGEELWGYLAMTSNNVKMTGYQYITNTALTTFQLAGTIAAGALVT
jgi:YHS domain-containing protein